MSLNMLVAYFYDKQFETRVLVMGTDCEQGDVYCYSISRLRYQQPTVLLYYRNFVLTVLKRQFDAA